MKGLKVKFTALVQDDLDAIEVELARNLKPHLDLVARTAGHILLSGGKRLRPLLMVLAARISGYQGQEDKVFSTAFEYLHAATLLHDDLVDGADLRRGRPTANTVWGNSVAVLVGDFLLARALSIGARTGSLKVIEILAAVTAEMSQGEIQQLKNKGRMDLSEDEYLEVIGRKTAVLIEGACRVGAVIAEAPREREAALGTYGFNLGLAFQMSDDLLDYLADSRILGKAVGTDLREGKLTLPVIHALAVADAPDRTYMQTLIGSPEVAERDLERFVDLLDRYGGLDYTRKLAADYIRRAKAALSPFDPSPTRELLLLTADYVLARQL